MLSAVNLGRPILSSFLDPIKYTNFQTGPKYGEQVKIPIEDHGDFRFFFGYSMFLPVTCPKTAQSAIGRPYRSDSAVYVPIYSNGGLDKSDQAWNSIKCDLLKLRDRTGRFDLYSFLYIHFCFYRLFSQRGFFI
jgi:hypothetical protein